MSIIRQEGMVPVHPDRPSMGCLNDRACKGSPPLLRLDDTVDQGIGRITLSAIKRLYRLRWKVYILLGRTRISSSLKRDGVDRESTKRTKTTTHPGRALLLLGKIAMGTGAQRQVQRPRRQLRPLQRAHGEQVDMVIPKGHLRRILAGGRTLLEILPM